MKILLCAVNTKYIHSNLAVNLLKAYSLRFDDEKKSDINIAEYTINNYAEDVLADIYMKKPEVLAFSCYIWNWDFIRSMFSDIKKVLPDTEIWLGGPEVSFDPEEILEKYAEVKGIMIGEGEATFKELAIDHYTKNSMKLKDIAGICYREGSAVRRSENRKLLDMDEIPFIYNEENIAEFENKIIYYETSRGCPFSCSYCLSSVDKSVRFRSIEKVYGELQFFLDHKVSQVKFVDRTFNVDHKHSTGILRYITKYDNGITNFHFEVAGDILTEEELSTMSEMRPGLIQLEIGVQSVNPDTIKEIHRTMNLDKLKSVVRRINEMGNIHQHLDLIAGLPYENYESFAHSFDEVCRMKPSQLQLGFLKVLKGAYIYSAVKKYNIVYKTNPVYEVMSTDWISFEEILKLKKIEEMVEIYYNTHQFSKTIELLGIWYDSPFAMFSELAEYYDRNGFFVNQPSRIYRYHVLLGFAEEKVPQAGDLFRESLTFDLYLREKCKSRPDFAPDLSEYKEVIKRLSIDKQQHADVFHYDFLSNDPYEMIRRKEEAAVTVFDYQNREKLYNNARAVIHTT